MLDVLLNKKTNEADIASQYQDVTPPYVSGLAVYGSSIYSICYGKVISIGLTVEDLYTVSVLTSHDIVIRYANLTNISVELNDIVESGTRIGNCKKFVRLEYCTTSQLSSQWVVRFNTLTVYKHNPEPLLNGEVILPSNEKDANPNQDVEVTDKYLLDELSGNQGDDEV